jgi:Recombinase
MNLMRDRVAQRGQYFGGRVPIGYILDENDRFIPYEPHACIVRWIFRRYRQIGNVAQIARELNARKYAFPPYETVIKAPYTNLTVKNGGYGITKAGVLSILKNVQYLGYFAFKQQVRRKDGQPVINHPPILTEIKEDDGQEVNYEELFWYAFNRLSPTTIDGEINEQRETITRYDQKNTVLSKALLKPVITTYNGTVYIAKESKGNNPEQYSIDLKVPDYASNHHAARVDVSLVDAAFSEKMFEHLVAWQEAEEAISAGQTIYEQLQQEKAEDKLAGLQVIEGQLEQLRPKIAHFDRLVRNGYDLDEEDLSERQVRAIGYLFPVPD